MVKRLRCVEGESFTTEPVLRDRLRWATDRLRGQLKTSFRILSEEKGQFTIQGVIGTIDLGGGASLEVIPKTFPSDDWAHAVFDLLEGSDRIDLGGSRLAGLAPPRRNLLEVMASIYASRLEKAFRRDGPLVLVGRRDQRRSSLKGKLQATRWSRKAVWEPHSFPVSYSELGADNDFSRGLALVARLLAGVTRVHQVRSMLSALASGLRPGLPEEFGVPQAVAGRNLPPQWTVYGPAWAIARAVLSQRSLLGSRGTYSGISIVIEVWPLLERLLERSLSALVRLASSKGLDVSVAPKTPVELLVRPQGTAVSRRVVIADGRILGAQATLATFEAKYKRRLLSQDWPNREDVYQALATAAACRSPLAVLIYPEEFEPASWSVEGMTDQPSQLAAIGLGLFSYDRLDGDLIRGKRLSKLMPYLTALH